MNIGVLTRIFYGKQLKTICQFFEKQIAKNKTTGEVKYSAFSKIYRPRSQFIALILICTIIRHRPILKCR